VNWEDALLTAHPTLAGPDQPRGSARVKGTEGEPKIEIGSRSWSAVARMAEEPGQQASQPAAAGGAALELDHGGRVHREGAGPVVRRVAREVATGVLFVVPSVWWMLLFAPNWTWANDGRIYRLAAETWLRGGDPWSVAVNGLHAAAPPIAVLAFVPAAMLPEPLFIVAWTAICLGSAVWIVNKLRLRVVWLFYPPLVFGVLLGNPAIPMLALALAGRWVLAVAVRPQLGLAMLAHRPRSAVHLAMATLLSFVVMPGYLGNLGPIITRYAGETLTTNAWGTLALVPLAALLLIMSRRDRVGAAWVASAACLPAMGWYGQTMLMPTRSILVAGIAGIPIPGMPIVAALVWTIRAIFQTSRTGMRPPGGSRTTASIRAGN
jgi:hypothetical protein